MTDTRAPEEIAQRRIEWFKAGNPSTANPEWRDVFPADDDDEEDDEGYQPAPDILLLSGIGLTEVPKEVFDLDGVDTLMLGNQPLKSLPAQIGKLETLVSLDLTFTQIETLPEELFDLPELSELYLQGSAIKSLPASFTRANLSMLTLDDTALEVFPDFTGTASPLSALTLGGFRGEALPYGICTIEGLRQLDCAGSALTHLPANIGQLQQLVQLKIQDCQLTSLPKSLADIQFVKFFDDHRKKAIARGADPKNLPAIPSLYGIHLSGNAFADKQLNEIAKMEDTEARTLAVQAWCRANGD